MIYNIHLNCFRCSSLITISSVWSSFDHRVINAFEVRFLAIDVNSGLFSSSKCLGVLGIIDQKKALGSLDTIYIDGCLSLGLVYSTAEDEFVVNSQLVGHFPAEHLFKIHENVGWRLWRMHDIFPDDFLSIWAIWLFERIFRAGKWILILRHGSFKSVNVYNLKILRRESCKSIFFLLHSRIFPQFNKRTFLNTFMGSFIGHEIIHLLDESIC